MFILTLKLPQRDNSTQSVLIFQLFQRFLNSNLFHNKIFAPQRCTFWFIKQSFTVIVSLNCNLMFDTTYVTRRHEFAKFLNSPYFRTSRADLQWHELVYKYITSRGDRLLFTTRKVCGFVEFLILNIKTRFTNEFKGIVAVIFSLLVCPTHIGAMNIWHHECCLHANRTVCIQF